MSDARHPFPPRMPPYAVVPRSFGGFEKALKQGSAAEPSLSGCAPGFEPATGFNEGVIVTAGEQPRGWNDGYPHAAAFQRSAVGEKQTRAYLQLRSG